MKLLLTFILAAASTTALTLSPAACAATAHPLGVGIVLGEPTGLSAKYNFDRHQAVDFGVGYSFNSFVFVFADYLYHFPGVFGSREKFFTQLTPYVGAGAILLASTASNRVDGRYFTGDGASAGFGLRLPLGIEWRPEEPRFGVFIEIVPGMGIVPGTYAFLEGGIGARFYF